MNEPSMGIDDRDFAAEDRLIELGEELACEIEGRLASLRDEERDFVRDVVRERIGGK